MARKPKDISTAADRVLSYNRQQQAARELQIAEELAETVGDMHKRHSVEEIAKPLKKPIKIIKAAVYLHQRSTRSSV